jgi:hypothetical protein
VTNAPGIKIEHETKTRVQTNQQKNERVKSDNDPHQAWDTEKTEAPFEFVEPSHRSATVAQQSITSMLSLSRKGQADSESLRRKNVGAPDPLPLLLDGGEDEREESKPS